MRFLGQVKMGPLTVSPMGFGTWAWGNQLLWGYQPSMDSQLQQVFNLAVENGINLFDTADSYGTGRLNGQSEKLLGKFIREFQGWLNFFFKLYMWVLQITIADKNQDPYITIEIVNFTILIFKFVYCLQSQGKNVFEMRLWLPQSLQLTHGV